MYLKIEHMENETKEDIISLYRALKENRDITGDIEISGDDISFELLNNQYGADDIYDLNEILQDTVLDAYIDFKTVSIIIEVENVIPDGKYDGLVI